MLTEERFGRILELLEQRRSVTVAELTKLLDTSESTIRRDLAALHSQGRLIKVHGGATAMEAYDTRDDAVAVRQDRNVEEKRRIARYAASLIGPEDLVYLDAGTTTDLLIDCLAERGAVFVTNGTMHARKLAQKGCQVHILGGQLKVATEAVVGGEALMSLRKYNFTKGFFGTNGIHLKTGYTTPDVGEALVKSEAMSRCSARYVLADPSKQGKISAVSFAKLSAATLVTTGLALPELKNETRVVEVDRA